MTPAALERFLRERIPITAAMGVVVETASAQTVVLTAPLEPNSNVHGTLFGGSAATLALLAAWSVLHLKLEAGGIANQLVIHRTEMDYLRPVSGAVRATAQLGDDGWEGFLHTLERRGRARLRVEAELTFEGTVAGKLAGEFVALSEK